MRWTWINPSVIIPSSSRGPTPDGRVKPDVVGVACGETTHRPLPRGFCGTSQSAPHVAGIAALVRQRFPFWGPVNVADYIRYHAVQRQATDPNNTWGYGLARLPAPLAPQRPRIITPVEAGPDWLVVRWEAPDTDGRDPAAFFQLEYATPVEDVAGSLFWTRVQDSSNEENCPCLSGIPRLRASTDYQVRVRGVNVWGEGEWSPLVAAPTTAPERPEPPFTFTATPEQGLARVGLSWTAPEHDGGADITGYRLEASVDLTTWEVIYTGPALSYVDDGTDDQGLEFAVGSDRHYRVSARNSAGYGEPNGPITVTVGGDSLISQYDTNRNGRIDRSEVIQAINDYLFGSGGITRADVIRLINLYLFG